MTDSIDTTILEQFKDRMHISHDGEDGNLKQLLSFSYARIQTMCGPFAIDKDEEAKELVFERARYAYNDATEYFEGNFLSAINGIGLRLAYESTTTTTTTEGGG